MENHRNISVRLTSSENKEIEYLHSKFNSTGYGKVSLADILRIAVNELYLIEIQNNDILVAKMDRLKREREKEELDKQKVKAEKAEKAKIEKAKKALLASEKESLDLDQKADESEDQKVNQKENQKENVQESTE